MKDENTENTDEETDSEQTTKPATDPGEMVRDSIVEIVQEYNSTFQTLAHSDLPVSEDARRALAMTDGGVEISEEESEQ